METLKQKETELKSQAFDLVYNIELGQKQYQEVIQKIIAVQKQIKEWVEPVKEESKEVKK